MIQLRQPRLRVLADGAPLPGALAAEVITRNHFGADCWSARFAVAADPAGLAGWDARADALIEVQIGFAAALTVGWTTLVTGNLDRISADPMAGVVEIEGRDLSAGLIEARTRESFANQTASEIATVLAGRHGLTAQVTDTITPVGRYYSADHDRVTLDRYVRASTEWDLLAWLAQQEAFDVFVTGTTLVFQPQNAGSALAQILRIAKDGSGNVSSVRLQRALSLAGDLDVTVKSWNSQQQMAFTQTARRSGSGNGSPQSFVYVRPNLSSDDAQSYAQQKLAALSAHEYVLTATMPGELALSPRDTVALAGTASSFDTCYVIDEIARRIDARHGFTQTLRARTAAGVN